MSETITGRVLGDRYQVTGYLRPAQMGDIYLARRLSDQERVTVKMLDPKLFFEPEAVARFERETRVTRQIEHPCSMRVLDHGHTEDGIPWLVMEHVEVDALSDLIEEQGAITPERAARIAGQIAQALHAAHALGVIHRDVQPGHVFLVRNQPEDVVKVTEFGLASVAKGFEEETLTAVGVRIGTPAYMAPEYIEDFALDPRVDLYALGVVLYEMLVGEPPYTGRPYKVMDMHLNAAIPRPSDRVPVPPWLDALVAGLMAKKPDDRLASAAEVVAAVERGLGTSLEVGAPPQVPRPPVAPAPRRQAAHVVDPILAALISQNTRSITRGEGQARRESALRVERVARPSIASEAGVREGWLLELPDEPLRGLRDVVLHHALVQERRYVFSSPDGAQRIELVATGMPIGVQVVRTAEHVRADYDPLSAPPDALLDLWRHRDWEALERLSFQTLAQQKSSPASGLLAWFVRSAPTIRLRNHPALLMYGIALIEQGKPGGADLVQEYRSQYAAQWPNVYNAIAHYSLGWLRAKTQADEMAVDLLGQSLAIWHTDEAAAALESILHRRPDRRSWVGQRFPEYGLDAVDGSGGDGLKEALGRMDDGQILLVCMLGGFRGNLDYDAFMQRYLVYGAWFPELIHGVHVITTVTAREVDKPQHYKNEDLVVRAGLRLAVLEDYRIFLQRAVKPLAIPTIYAIDKSGMVAHEGQLLGADLWETLALAGKWRMERLLGQ